VHIEHENCTGYVNTTNRGSTAVTSSYGLR
jgi:hypothetical protein